MSGGPRRDVMSREGPPDKRNDVPFDSRASSPEEPSKIPPANLFVERNLKSFNQRIQSLLILLGLAYVGRTPARRDVKRGPDRPAIVVLEREEVWPKSLP